MAVVLVIVISEDIIFFDVPVKRFSINAEQSGRPCLVPGGLLEGPEDRLCIDALIRPAGTIAGLPGGRNKMERELIGGYGVPAAEDEGMFQGMF